ncbi:MAG: hypothetical protein SF066_13985 [Thermoanaerobaculia bacterium]|nr:hypothetical protein [Thermoanaerobaculia bacterium]
MRHHAPNRLQALEKSVLNLREAGAFPAERNRITMSRNRVTPSGSEANEPVVYSIRQFCATHQISKSKLYQLFKIGEGPAVLRVGRRRLITAVSAAAWRRRQEEKP